MILVSRTYWAGMPFWFRKKPDAHVESLALRTQDMRQIRGLYWQKRKSDGERDKPRVGVVIMHPRVDFTHHYAVPRLVEAGFGVVAANTRWFGNETMAEHEDMIVDLAACVAHLREKRGVEKVVVLGNCGGASLGAYYQAEQKGADGIIYVAAHRGQGKVLEACIDPSVVDENDVLSVDAALDMYDTRNGFVEPPAPSKYDDGFLAKYRAAQRARVQRIDARARELIARREAAPDMSRAKAAETVMVVYRTMANPAFVDPSIDPSERDYGSLLSERPDLMNYAALGLARTVTPRAWLSTWSGTSSRADLVANAARIDVPTLMVHAGRDREVFPTDVRAIAEAIVAKDKTVTTIDGARHYFEPDFGEKETPHVEKLMDVIVPWIEERFA